MRQRALQIAACAIAAANLALGVAMSGEADRLGDFEQVQLWAAQWLAGLNPYAPPASVANYPPNALVVLSPLALLATAAVPVWIVVNLAFAAAIGAMAARLGGRPPGWMCLTLALAPFRTLNQFSLAAFAPALAGTLASGRRPILAGIAIGFGLIKPQIGGPALLWAIAARRWRTVAAALAVPGALFAIYLAQAQSGPVAVLADYGAALLRNQNRPDLVPGETNLAPLFGAFGLPAVGAQVVIAACLLLFLPIVWRRADPSERDLRFFAAVSLISLLAFRHLSYNLLLAVPALMWAVSHGARNVRVSGRVAFALLVASPPTLWRYMFEPAGAGALVEHVLVHAYRVVLLVLFGLVVAAPGDANASRPSLRRQSSA